MADIRIPAQAALDTEIPAQLSAAVRDFQENALLPLLEAVHRAEARLPHWEDRAAAGDAATATERTRLLLEDGEIGEALAFLQDAVALEALEPQEVHPFATASAQIETAWTDWRERHALSENALPRTYPFAAEDRTQVQEVRPDTEDTPTGSRTINTEALVTEPDIAEHARHPETEAPTPADRAAAAGLSAWRPGKEASDEIPSVESAQTNAVRDPEISPRRPQTGEEATVDKNSPEPETADQILSGAPLEASPTPATEQEPGSKDAAPPLDLPSDQEAAELATKREAEEREARALLAGKSPDDAPENDTKNAAEQSDEEPEAELQASPQTDETRPEAQTQTTHTETPPSEPGKQDPESTSPQETHISGKNVTIRSAGFLATLARGFNQRRDMQLKSQEEKQKAQRQDAAREKFSDFTVAAHDLERLSEALLHHPVMEAVRQAAPKGLDQADAQQKALVGSIVNSNPAFQSQVQTLQNQHAEVTRRFDALAPELDEFPAKERRAYTDIADLHMKKAEERLQQIPDQKGDSIWERLKESFRAIGQHLGIIGPDLDVPRQVTTPAAAPAVQTPRPGRR